MINKVHHHLSASVRRPVSHRKIGRGLLIFFSPFSPFSFHFLPSPFSPSDYKLLCGHLFVARWSVSPPRAVNKMGILSRFEKRVPSTAEDPAAISTAAHLDPEKQDAAQFDGGDVGSSNGRPAFHVTSEMEKRVVRKLDQRLVPLVMGLCTKCLLLNLVIYWLIADLLAYLDRSNIGWAISPTNKQAQTYG